MNFKIASVFAFLIVMLPLGCKKDKTVVREPDTLVQNTSSTHNSTPPQFTLRDTITGSYVVSGNTEYFDQIYDTTWQVPSFIVVFNKTSDSSLLASNLISNNYSYNADVLLFNQAGRNNIGIETANWLFNNLLIATNAGTIIDATFSVISIDSVLIQINITQYNGSYHRYESSLTGHEH